jgi:hypothetical protein
MSLESILVGLLTTNVVATGLPRRCAKRHTSHRMRHYMQFGGEAVTFIGAEVPGKRNANIQIDIYCTTRAEAVSLMLAVESALTTVYIATGQTDQRDAGDVG